MAGIFTLFETHGVLSVFFGVLVEQLGAPVPAVPFLLLAGAHAATDAAFALKTLVAASSACLIADTLWFLAGRRYGRSILGLLCRVSLSPGTCVQKSEMSFARRGVLTILFAKFIPGVSTLTSPMAGAMRMPLRTFVLLDLAGTILWVGCALAAGLVFRRQVKELVGALADLGGSATIFLIALLAVYVGWRALRRLLVHRTLRTMPRLSPRDVSGRMKRGEAVVLLDVRSDDIQPHSRIPGAWRAPADGPMIQAGQGLPPGHMVVTYCDCPHDATAARAAEKLASHGFVAHVLDGGLPAWAAAGLPLVAETAGPSSTDRLTGGEALQLP